MVRCREVFIACAFWSASVVCVAGGEFDSEEVRDKDPKEPPPARLIVIHEGEDGVFEGTAPYDGRIWDFTGSLDLQTDGTKNPSIINMGVGHPQNFRDKASGLPQFLAGGAKYPLLKIGDAVPMCGKVYRFQRVERVKLQRSGSSAFFELVPEKDLPSGMTHPGSGHKHPENLNVVPIGGTLTCIPNTKVVIRAVHPDQTKKEILVAEATVERDVPDGISPRSSRRIMTTPTLQIGSSFSGKLDSGKQVEYIVEGMVPSDPKTKFIGWVLFRSRLEGADETDPSR